MKKRLAKLRLGVLPAIALAATLSAPTSHANDLNDAAIIAIYNQVNTMDIETALLGQVKGYSADVRQLATMVSRDHSGVRKMAHELAEEIGVTPTLPAARADAAKQHYEVIARLRDQSQTGFDKAYLKHEIEFHRAAISAVKTILLPSAQHPALKNHFNQVLPHFEHHLSETIRVAKKLNVQ